MSDKKILILTLGVGQPSDKEEKEKVKKELNSEEAYECLKNAKYDYRNATYQLDDQQIKAPFVGEALISSFKPDEIVIVGTIRSMWPAIYYRNSEKVEEEERKACFYKIWDITNKNDGYKTTEKELDEKQNELNNLMKNIAINVHIILMEYGPKDSEIVREMSNYRRMCKISNIIEKMNDADVEVALDITHCFRSIPIYDLAVLNYIKALGDKKINISHVYYGNLDINRECKGVSPVENLNYLSTLMDLAGAINTFRETGNARCLIDEYRKLNEKDLVEVMTSYEWATQSNDFDKIIRALRSLINVKKDGLDQTETLAFSEKPIVEDSQKMIADILKKEFGELIIPQTTEEKTMLQYKLACWYHKQHRYGLALATGLEAYRGIFVQISNGDSIDDEASRRNAIAKLKRVAAKTENKWLKQVDVSIESVKDIRNAFAHCLDGTNKLLPDYKEAIKKEKDFFDHFEKFMKMRMENGASRKQYEYDYLKDYSNGEKKIIDGNKKIRFVISENYPLQQELEDRFSKSKATKKEYFVSQISEEQYQEVKKEKKSNQMCQLCKFASKAIEDLGENLTVIINMESIVKIAQCVWGLRHLGVEQDIQIYNEKENKYEKVGNMKFEEE